MASGKESTAASSSMGEGSGGSHQAAEGVTVAVAPPSSSQPEPVPAPVEDRGKEIVVAEDKDSPPPLENVPDAMEGVEGDAPPPPPEPVAFEEVAGGEIAPPAVADFACEICGARYPTEKAMFGHLRSHKDRGWRGAFSPPTFTMEEFAEYRELLVKPEEEQLREIAEEEERAAAGGRVVLDVDLNEEAAEVEEFILPDLNLPPPPDAE